jgi:hypothetical protein
MVFSAVRAAILRGSQELAPQDDAEIASQDEAEKAGQSYAASTRRKPFHIAVAAPEVSTGRIRAS